MSAGIDELGDEGLGAISDERFVEAAIAGARSVVESEPALERWVTPLIRAIERERLRLPSLSPTVHRVVELIESADVDLDELAVHLGQGIAHQIQAGWPDDVANPDLGLVAVGAKLGVDADRLADIASESEANFEALDKLDGADRRAARVG